MDSNYVVQHKAAFIRLQSKDTGNYYDDVKSSNCKLKCSQHRLSCSRLTLQKHSYTEPAPFAAYELVIEPFGFLFWSIMCEHNKQ